MKAQLALVCCGLLFHGSPLLAEEPAAVPAEPREAVSDRNLVEAGKLILFDTGDLLTAPVRWDGTDWLKFGIGAAVVTTTVLALDQPIREASQRSRTTSRDDFATAIQSFGAGASWAVIGAFAVAGWGFDDSKSRRVAVDAVSASLIASGIVTTTVKYAVGRYRPGDTEATWTAKPFSGNISFPSGHATQAFALAAVVSGHYKQPWVRVTAFFIAGCVGLARIQLNEHYASDVVMGALIGTAVGGTVVALNESRRAAPTGKRVTVTPLLLRKGGGIQAAAVF
ncbi:MAG TPA: phosphatase PAP2 family protein [Thermoanaerobaculia bacterium]|nr:phosphatase PAP2 family protein [Thermoanaerobaculia bacterium]